MTMYKCILSNIIDSETNYVEWLGVLLKVSVTIKRSYFHSTVIVSVHESYSSDSRNFATDSNRSGIENYLLQNPRVV